MWYFYSTYLFSSLSYNIRYNFNNSLRKLLCYSMNLTILCFIIICEIRKPWGGGEKDDKTR
mgnify:CR=1 FL=1